MSHQSPTNHHSPITAASYCGQYCSGFGRGCQSRKPMTVNSGEIKSTREAEGASRCPNTAGGSPTQYRSRGPPPGAAPVQGRDRRLRLFLAGHVHKGKAAGASGISIHDDTDFKHLAATFLKERAELLLIHAEEIG